MDYKVKENNLMNKDVKFSDLLGQVLTEITGIIGSEEITFKTQEGKRFLLRHDQDCCESVEVNDIIGDFNDLIGSPLVQAEEVSNENTEPKPSNDADSWTWTFYKIATVKGYVTIKWLGESNGYYSESVEFVELIGE